MSFYAILNFFLPLLQEENNVPNALHLPVQGTSRSVTPSSRAESANAEQRTEAHVAPSAAAKKAVRIEEKPERLKFKLYFRPFPSVIFSW